MQRHIVIAAVLLAACSAEPPQPFRPVDLQDVHPIYETTLENLKASLTPRDTLANPIRWNRHIYLNEIILAPPDSTRPMHDRAWLARIQASGLIRGYCGQPPAIACHDQDTMAFTSLGIPLTREGDSAVVETGIVSTVPGEREAMGTFRRFVLKRDTTPSGWRVVVRGPTRLLDYTPPEQQN
ncbi:MAG: hypothetical protein AB7I33_05715 [Gemmatimonadales bacterium]